MIQRQVCLLDSLSTVHCSEELDSVSIAPTEATEVGEEENIADDPDQENGEVGEEEKNEDDEEKNEEAGEDMDDDAMEDNPPSDDEMD